MKYTSHKLLCALMPALGLLLLGGCGSLPSGPATNTTNNAPVSSGSGTRMGCAAMTDEIAAIAGLKLRTPLDLSAPNEGLLRGCVWGESGGASALLK